MKISLKDDILTERKLKIPEYKGCVIKDDWFIAGGVYFSFEEERKVKQKKAVSLTFFSKRK